MAFLWGPHDSVVEHFTRTISPAPISLPSILLSWWFWAKTDVTLTELVVIAQTSRCVNWENPSVWDKSTWHTKSLSLKKRFSTHKSDHTANNLLLHMPRKPNRLEIESSEATLVCQWEKVKRSCFYCSLLWFSTTTGSMSCYLNLLLNDNKILSQSTLPSLLHEPRSDCLLSDQAWHSSLFCVLSFFFGLFCLTKNRNKNIRLLVWALLLKELLKEWLHQYSQSTEHYPAQFLNISLPDLCFTEV